MKLIIRLIRSGCCKSLGECDTDLLSLISWLSYLSSNVNAQMTRQLYEYIRSLLRESSNGLLQSGRKSREWINSRTKACKLPLVVLEESMVIVVQRVMVSFLLVFAQCIYIQCNGRSSQKTYSRAHCWFLLSTFDWTLSNSCSRSSSVLDVVTVCEMNSHSSNKCSSGRK